VTITEVRKFTRTALNDILNLILHIVYKRAFVRFPKDEHGQDKTKHGEAVRRLAECAYSGGYNVTGEILSFLSQKDKPVILLPTRWGSTKKSLA